MRYTALLCLLSHAIFEARGQNLCQWPFESIPGSTDMCYFFNVTGTNWYVALEDCVKMDAFLATPETPEEVNALKTHVVEVLKKNMWLGGSDLGREGRWIWHDTFEDILYSNWAVGQPDDLSQRQECLAMDWSKDYKWADDFCLQNYAYVCQKEAVGSCSAEEEEQQEENISDLGIRADAVDIANCPFTSIVCPNRFVKLMTGCYFFSNKVKVSFDDAGKHCTLMKATRATIPDDMTHTALSEYLYNYLGSPETNLHWLDGYANDNTGYVWKWESTGETITNLKYWKDTMAPQPDGQIKMAQCMSLGNYENDTKTNAAATPCSYTFSYICKFNQ